MKSSEVMINNLNDAQGAKSIPVFEFTFAAYLCTRVRIKPTQNHNKNIPIYPSKEKLYGEHDNVVIHLKARNHNKKLNSSAVVEDELSA